MAVGRSSPIEFPSESEKPHDGGLLYPGKVIYAALPYAWAARLYAVAHSALAFAGVLALMRSWGTSWAGTSWADAQWADAGWG